MSKNNQPLIEHLAQIAPGEYRLNYPLAKATWFKTGGPAEILYKPENSAAIAALIKNKPQDLPVTVIGVGSNLLVRDGGVPGMVIKFGRSFNFLEIHDDKIEIGAGCLCPNVAQFAAEHALAGFEFMAGIPGSIGGALRMNAGAYGSDTSSVLLAAEAVFPDGSIKILKQEEIGYVYRGSELAKGVIFTRGFFKKIEGDQAEIKARIQEIMREREETQPVKTKTSGSTFKNPPGMKAWQLIDQAGCRGLQIGDAKVSEKHCNFFINSGTATSQQIEDLIMLVQERVRASSGVQLEVEVEIIGRR